MLSSIRSPANIAYIVSSNYVKECDRNVKVLNRASATHLLISAYELTTGFTNVSPEIASEDELRLFHSQEYIECIKNVSKHRHFLEDCDFAVEYGLGYDCPILENLYSYVRAVAGATITAAKCLTNNSFNIAINWGGGWHHAKKDEAAGFCYINDIVLGILVLKNKFQHVLYVDLDVHHGDGVEDAFAYTPKVMTVSFHKHEAGFYPGSGDVSSTGLGKGKTYAVNVPLQDGMRDDQYFNIFSRVMTLVKDSFAPDVIICQCGADGLAGDPVEAFNLTPVGLGKCVEFLLEWNLPILFLGGGGYNVANTARCWTYLTSLITQIPLSSDIPDNPYFTEYGPDFTLEVLPGNRTNKNKEEDVEKLLFIISKNLHRNTSNGDDKQQFCEFF